MGKLKNTETGEPMLRWEDNIMIFLRIHYVGVSIVLDQDKIHLGSFINTVINAQVPQEGELRNWLIDY
jgi:hypothetical protein